MEASVFAIEFLLPVPIVRDLFIKGKDAEDISELTGIATELIHPQLIEALLPDLPDIASPTKHAKEDVSQNRAILSEGKATLVLAGPGTGKTTSLISHAEYLLRNGTHPENILVLTFSNNATDELFHRIEESYPEAAERMWIGTFHSFGLEVLRRFGNLIDFPSNAALIDEVDAIPIMERYLDKLDLTPYVECSLKDPIRYYRNLYYTISRCKDELLFPETLFEHPSETGGILRSVESSEYIRKFAHVYVEWDRILREERRMDFGDLIALPVKILQSFPEVLAQVRSEFPYILVDEYQDINRATTVLIELLAGDGEGLWAVGDNRQAIYGFRGAYGENFREFSNRYSNAAMMHLQRNYRSQPEIVDLLNQIVNRENNGMKRDRWIPYRKTAKAKIQNIIAKDRNDQLEAMKEIIKEDYKIGEPYSSNVILCRTYDQAETVAGYMNSKDVPTLYFGSLMDRNCVKDMLSLLSYCRNGDEVSRRRILSFREYHVSEDDTGQIGVGICMSHVDALRSFDNPFKLLMQYLYKLSRYLYPLLLDDSVTALQERIALNQFLFLLHSHVGRLDKRNSSGIGDFLDWVELMENMDAGGKISSSEHTEVVNAVRVMTLHKSKGLEFPSVFIPFLEEMKISRRGILKSLLPFDERDSVDEERRLYFVGVSRAMDRLTLLHTGSEKTQHEFIDIINDIIKPSAFRQVANEEIFPKLSDKPMNTSAGILIRHPEVTLHSLLQFERCPRRYLYLSSFGFPATVTRRHYGWFQHLILVRIREMHSKRLKGEDISFNNDLHAYEEEWDSPGIPDTQYSERLRNYGRQLLWNYHHLIFRINPLPITSLSLSLAHGSVKLPIDIVSNDLEDRRIIYKLLLDPIKKEDKNLPEIALIRRAMMESYPDWRFDILLYSLYNQENLRVDADPPRELRRVEKINALLKRLGEEYYVANPGYECRICPFRIICNKI